MKQSNKKTELRYSWGNWPLEKRVAKEEAVRDFIRREARAQGYKGTEGLKGYMEENYKATLRFNKWLDLNGIIFTDEKLAMLFWLKADA